MSSTRDTERPSEADDALLRSLVANVPGAIYRCSLDADWTMEWISDAIETIAGYPAADFIHSAKRTFASVIHPDDREHVERTVARYPQRGFVQHVRMDQGAIQIDNQGSRIQD